MPELLKEIEKMQKSPLKDDPQYKIFCDGIVAGVKMTIYFLKEGK